MGRLNAWLAVLVSVALAASVRAESPPELQSPLFQDAVPQEPASRWVGEPVTLSLRDADLVEVLRTFARLGELNMILQPGIKGKVTVELKEVPWDQALSTILKINGLGMDISEGTLRVAPPKALQRMIEDEARRPSPLIIPTYRVTGIVQHLDAGAVVRLLEKKDLGFLTPRGSASADGNELTVWDLRRRLDSISKMIAALDVPGARRLSDSQLEARADQWWRENVGTGGF